MAKEKKMNMLEGSIMDKLLLFALPLAASSILQQLFNSADVAVAGKFAGPDALAAVGGNSAVINLLVNLFVGLSIGANVVIANYIGQKKPDQAKESVHTTVALSMICGLILMVIGLFSARFILELIDTPAETLDAAVLYLRIYFLGMPFIMFYNFSAAILRSVGDTKRPLYCLIVSGIVNVLLNLFFVIVCRIDVAGVALATVLSNVISAGMILYYLMHAEDTIRFEPARLKLHGDQVLKIMRIGIPAGLQGIVFSFSNVCIQSGINSLGKHAVAGSAAALNYEYFTYFVTNAFAQAVVTFTSQNYAAKEYGRCKRIFRQCMLLGLVITAVMSIIFVGANQFFMEIYTSDAEAIRFGIIRLTYVELLECMTCLYEISGGALRGMGYSLLPSLMTVFGCCVVRLIWLYTVFKQYHTFAALMTVYPFSWVVTTILVLGAYYIVRGHLFRRNAS